MYAITQSIFRHHLPSEIHQNNACKVTKVAIATLSTLALGVVGFSVIFFTTHLLTPSIVVFISVVILLGGIDLCITIYCKNRNNPEINLLGDQPFNDGDKPAGHVFHEEKDAESFSEESADQMDYEDSFEEQESNIGNNQVQLQSAQNDQAALVTVQEAKKTLDAAHSKEDTKVLEKDIPEAKVFALKELVFEILKFLNAEDFCKAELVCRQWKDICDQVLQKRISSINALTKDFQYHSLNDEEIHLYILFVVMRQKNIHKEFSNLTNILGARKDQKIWNNYYIEFKENNSIFIKNLIDPEICHKINSPCKDNNFKYFLMNGYLLIVTKKNIGLYIWNLIDGSTVGLPDEVMQNFKTKQFSDLGPPYIYQNILVRNIIWGSLVKIQDLSTLEITHDEFYGGSSNGSHKIKAYFEKYLVIHSDCTHSSKISIFNLETKEMTYLMFMSNSRSDDELKEVVLNNNYVVISFLATMPCEKKYVSKLVICKKSLATNSFSKKNVNLPYLVKKLYLINNLLLASEISGKTFILNLSLPEQDIWEKGKTYIPDN